ncbi:hypothetical protein O1611_g3288 [Lasiodiplodia mahajangana]|uniref:Uncharacterized protein n=1 Tax=Lasiodiplodia mahajangana TaxID=1108764 RepID=A0ACC2JS70_9PEZI|nr:hypothetical protein O1611_g3288 [Lasiodiplodia mahajangana]
MPRNKSKNKKAAKAAKEAPKKHDVVVQWEQYMGHGELGDWQRLMRDLGFEEEFTSKSKCRKALKTVWVNIPDFLDAVKHGQPVFRFQSQRALAAYTREEHRVYPRNNIPKGSPLKQLLAQIFREQGFGGGRGYGNHGLVAALGGLSIA